MFRISCYSLEPLPLWLPFGFASPPDLASAISALFLLLFLRSGGHVGIVSHFNYFSHWFYPALFFFGLFYSGYFCGLSFRSKYWSFLFLVCCFLFNCSFCGIILFHPLFNLCFGQVLEAVSDLFPGGAVLFTISFVVHVWCQELKTLFWFTPQPKLQPCPAHSCESSVIFSEPVVDFGFANYTGLIKFLFFSTVSCPIAFVVNLGNLKT